MTGLLEALIQPPLLNSANPWATTEEDLKALLDCPFTGAVTVRTSLLQGFQHDDKVHQYAFFDAATQAAKPNLSIASSSLNTLGYSPITVQEYLEIITRLSSPAKSKTNDMKPFIVSVTGSPSEVQSCHQRILECSSRIQRPMFMEINLSCPNIPGKPPPAYDGEMLEEYLSQFVGERPFLQSLHSNDAGNDVELVCTGKFVPIGIKTPPYTYAGQFQTLIDALLSSVDPKTSRCPISFITAVNTLGSSLIMDISSRGNEVRGGALNRDDSTIRNWRPILSSTNGTGIGGLAGAALHPLALGNVATLRRMLDEATIDGRHPLSHIQIIGTGGISSRDGYERMRAAGATCVGVGTALGVFGVEAFESIFHGDLRVK